MYFSAKEFYSAAKLGHVTFPVRITPKNWKLFFSSYEQYRHAVTVLGATYRHIPPTKITLHRATKYLRHAKRALINRTYLMPDGNRISSKWYRPWVIVPKLRSWKAPQGDFGIGVEVEMGFRSNEEAAVIANKCKNWKYVTADREGGTYPIEMTFPPVRYSGITNRTAVMKYMDVLQEHQASVVQHRSEQHVGTHINVSLGQGDGSLAPGRITQLNICLEQLPPPKMIRYFGRRPYGWCYYGDYGNHYVEFKLFNSTTDKAALKRYIHISVELVKLMKSEEVIDLTSVGAALERGYNKKRFIP